jgi:hypothetical protein
VLVGRAQARQARTIYSERLGDEAIVPVTDPTPVSTRSRVRSAAEMTTVRATPSNSLMICGWLPSRPCRLDSALDDLERMSRPQAEPRSELRPDKTRADHQGDVGSGLMHPDGPADPLLTLCT